MKNDYKGLYKRLPILGGSKNRIRALFRAFTYAPTEFKPIPFVFLNDDMDVDVTEEILVELRDKGFGGVALAARTGITVPFASKLYWKRLSAIVGKAGRLSLLVWLSDDYNWPSGTAAGRVLAERPDFCAEGISFRVGRHLVPGEHVLGTYSPERA